MRRTNIYLSESQLGSLRAVSQATGQPVAELVREAVDRWLESIGVGGPMSEDEWSARFAELLARRDVAWNANPVPQQELENEVTEAVAEVRRLRAASRR